MRGFLGNFKSKCILEKEHPCLLSIKVSFKSTQQTTIKTNRLGDILNIWCVNSFSYVHSFMAYEGFMHSNKYKHALLYNELVK